MHKFGKFSVFSLKLAKKKKVQEASFGPNISSASSIVIKKSVKQVPKFGVDQLYKPLFCPFRSHTPTKMKVEYPPPPPGKHIDHNGLWYKLFDELPVGVLLNGQQIYE